ncbi:valine--tRNA ligase, partial [Singulisphaera rosea]
PETMLGDTAVAVHPEDPRYQHLIGKTLTLPLVGREIPIIADPILVDPKFGTGCVKVTPAHDPNDYLTGQRHRLPMINLLNPDGTYNENAGPYAGLPGKAVRKRVVADLEAQGALVKVEPYANRVGISDRSKTPIEPYLSDQWFVRMDDLAQSAMDAVTSGRVKIHPERYAKSYLDWLGEKRDWCISRQLWWGHRIPIWYCEGPTEEDLRNAFGDRADVSWRAAESGGWLICSETDLSPDALGPGVELTQDPDVLDTWFSSALWPHSTLGWPEETAELAKYYPTSVLSTARDIITLWVARMVIFGLFNRDEVPFRDVFIHPVIQDGQGRRMSKSLGNGIDPVDIIDLYGADALRYTLASSATETQDLRMPVEKATLPDGREVNTSERFEQGRTFPNKLWNAARLVLMNLEGYEPAPVDFAGLPVEDRWILGSLAETARATTEHLERFHFSEATRGLRDFTWDEFCDWYLEFVKARLRDPDARPVAQRVLATLLDGLCRLLHPIMPFVTEQV